MKTNFLFYTIILFSFFSCKDSNVDVSTDATEEQDLSNRLKITVSLTAKTDDNFCMLYTDDGTINFGEKVVWTSIKGSENQQNLVFIFPKDEFPTLFRLDLGQSEKQEDIILQEIKFEFQKNTRILKGAEIGPFFRADNTNCDFDYNTGQVKAKTVNGKKLNPILYPHETCQKVELSKLYK